jgi:hypothetical protein
MRQLTYYLQFTRPAGSPEGAAAIAYGNTLATTIGSPVDGCLTLHPGATALMTNTAVFNADSTLFFENGSIAFGGGTSLTFISIGAGVVLGQPDPSSPLLHGTVMWKVTAGSGKLAGVTGAIVSNFLVDPATNQLIDNQLHMLWLP